MQKKKFLPSAELKSRLLKMRDILKDVPILDDESADKVKGGCGGTCHVTCSWWCEDRCQESCAFTSEEFHGMFGEFCKHKPMNYDS